MSSEYKRLRKEWYGLLKEVGFEDIEQDDEKLKAWHSRRFLGLNRANVDNIAAKEAFFYYAYHFLHKHKFEKEIHKIIWEQYADGLGHKAITKLLNDTGAFKASRSTICKIINHYRKIMLSQIE